MRVYTVQMAKHRLCTRLDIPIIDITAKSGIVEFAPVIADVMRFKKGELSWDVYVDIYLSKLRETYGAKKFVWTRLFQHQTFAVACFCPYGKNCHRYVFVEVLKKIAEHNNIAFEYLGDVTEDTTV